MRQLCEHKGLGENKVDHEQRELLHKCIEKGDPAEWNQWREDSPDTKIWLQGVDFGRRAERPILRRINMQDANLARAQLPCSILVGADLRGAVLVGANLRKAVLVNADLRDAHLLESDLRGTNLRGTDLRETKCAYSKVDSETLFLTDRIDKETDFTGVPLGSMRIEPGLKQLLEYNVRHRRWQQWYRDHRCLAPGAWLFWLMCDYGRSTWRILISFSVLAVGFAAAYTLLPDCVVAIWAEHPGQPLSFGYSLYFSIVTMTTLGLGDVYAAPNSGLGQFLLSLQVMFGYILLGALITRFAILFTAGGPSSSFFPAENDNDEADQSPR